MREELWDGLIVSVGAMTSFMTLVQLIALASTLPRSPTPQASVGLLCPAFLYGETKWQLRPFALPYDRIKRQSLFFIKRHSLFFLI